MPGSMAERVVIRLGCPSAPGPGAEPLAAGGGCGTAEVVPVRELRRVCPADRRPGKVRLVRAGAGDRRSGRAELLLPLAPYAAARCGICRADLACALIPNPCGWFPGGGAQLLHGLCHGLQVRRVLYCHLGTPPQLPGPVMHLAGERYSWVDSFNAVGVHLDRLPLAISGPDNPEAMTTAAISGYAGCRPGSACHRAAPCADLSP